MAKIATNFESKKNDLWTVRDIWWLIFALDKPFYIMLFRFEKIWKMLHSTTNTQNGEVWYQKSFPYSLDKVFDIFPQPWNANKRSPEKCDRS